MSVLDPNPRRPWFFWCALAAGTVVAGAYLFALVVGGAPSTLGWDAAPSGHAWFVTGVEPSGPAAGQLAVGDQLLAVNRSPRAAEFGPDTALAGVGAGNAYMVAVRRNGTVREFQLRIAPRPDMPLQALTSFVIGLLLLAVGVWIGMSRPDQPTTQVGCAAFLCGSLLFVSDYMSAYQPSLSRAAIPFALLLDSLWRPFHLPLGYDFASRFPSSVSENRFWRVLRIGFYVAAAVFWIPLNLPVLADVLGLSSRNALLPPGFPLASFDNGRFVWIRILDVIVTAALCAALVRNYLILPDAGSRRRMRWAGAGLAVAAAPMALDTLAQLVLSAAGHEDLAKSALFDWLETVSMALVGVTALTLAYAIVRHRVLGIRVVIRRGVQYLLAKNVLSVLLISPALILGLQLLLHPELPVGESLQRNSWPFYALLALGAGTSLRYRKPMRRWVDRKFFRTAYEQDETLVALIDRIKSSESMEEVSRIVAREIEMALHPSAVYLAYKEPDERVALGYSADDAVGCSVLHAVTGRLLPELNPPYAAQILRDPPELRDLLCIPFTGTAGRLHGVLLLGPKRSEEPYTRRDRHLIQAIAGQIAVVCEVLQLKERMRQEQRVKEEVLYHLPGGQNSLLNECPVCGACYDGASERCALDEAPLTLTLPVERVIEGKYRLDRRIGTGGMGAVFETSDLRLNRSVAVKILTGRLFGNQSALRRFEREARVVARLAHPHIVPIFDYGLLGGGGAYLVMPLVRGPSWRAELKADGAIMPARAALWIDQLCDAVAAAHAAGIVHRDLKPENAIISTGEQQAEHLMVLDFGLAKMRTEEPPSSPDTTVGIVLGTFAYMSPEQRAGQEVDARADIFSVGVMAVETVSGWHPPPSGATTAWVGAALHHQPPQLVELLQTCLAVKPEGRFRDIAAFRQELVRLVRESHQPQAASAGGAADARTNSLSE